MTDVEWDSWQSTWSEAAGPLPDVRARTRREVRSHLFANVSFFAVVVLALAAGVSVLAQPEHDPWVHAIGWIIVAFFVLMSVGYVAIQRGIALRASATPRAALGFFERRLRVERLAAHLVRWGYLALFVAFSIVFPRVVAGHHSPRLEMGISFSFMLVVLAVTFTAPWWVARRNRRLEVEIEGWRRWMDEQQL